MKHQILNIARHFSFPTAGISTTTLRTEINIPRRFTSSVRSANDYDADFFARPPLPVNTIIKFVPQQEAWVVERMGKFHKVLSPGLAILVPILDRVRYVKSLKEIAMEIPSQAAITLDNVTLDIDGVLYIRVTDPFKASYGVEDAEYAVSQLAQTTMRSEIGQLSLDAVLKERQQLNLNITEAINEAAADWGVKCLRYEIRDIRPPKNVLQAMHQQVSAERSKRALILESEGSRQSAINRAEGQKQAVILSSEAVKTETINRAQADAQAILLRAQATARGIELVSEVLKNRAAVDAVGLTVAEKYVEAFGKLAKEGTTLVIPAGMADVGGMVASSLGIFQKVKEGLNATPSENKIKVLAEGNEQKTQ